MGAQAKRRKIQVCLAWPARMVRREIECGSFLQKNKPGRIPFRFPKGECLAARSCLLKAVASGEWGEGKKQIPPDKTRDSRASSGARQRHLRQRLRRLPRTRAETVKQIPHRRSRQFFAARLPRASATGFGMTGRRLQVRAEGQQTAIAILHHELPLVPGHVPNASSEFPPFGAVLRIDR